MTFPTEPEGYAKTIISDLQGAWEVFRASVVDSCEAGGFGGADKVLFQTDEAMSWETVRNLERMPPLLLIVQNLCQQGHAPDEVVECLEMLSDVATAVQTKRLEGKIR